MAADPSTIRTTRTVDAEAMRQALPAVTHDGERVVVEENGVPLAALVSLDDLRKLAQLDAERLERFKVFERIADAFADEDPDESDRLSALAVQEAREQMRREREAQSGT